MVDTNEYENLARETGAFKDIELDLIRDAFSAWRKSPGDPYTILEIRDGKILAGFTACSRKANTDFSFDLLALCVDPSYVGKGITSGLLGMIEDELLRTKASAILRVEISSLKEAAIGKGILSERGYSLIGHIPDFYGHGDDYYMYAKHLRRAVEVAKTGGV
jgi:GNAT superfamily N-acetyltransferase